MYPYCFFNGKIIQSNKPLIALNDIAILRGYAAFDFMRIYNKKPFCFKEHMNRFRNTAKLMGLKIDFSNAQIEDILTKLIKRNKAKDYQARFVLTGGETKNGIEPSIPVFYILFEKLSNLPDVLYIKGAKLITHNHQRTLPYAKNSNYMQAVLLQKKRKKEKAIEILYTSGGLIYEASTSNIFIVKDKNIFTPQNDILKGVTRALTIRLAKKLKYTVIEKDILISEMLAADEVFITATNKKVLPIVKIDSHIVDNGKVGQITKELLNAYNKSI